MISKFTKLALFAFMLMAVLSANAQFNTISLRVQKGNLKFLKGQKKINVIYTYNDMGVGNMSEEEYVKKKMAEHNEDKAGKGEEWHKGWIAAREDRYKPKFETLMNKRLEKAGVMVGNFPNADYTMIVHTNFIEPGWHAGVMKKPAFANYDINFVKTGTEASIATVIINNSLGGAAMGMDFDAGARIQECYAKAGKEFGHYLVKNNVL